MESFDKDMVATIDDANNQVKADERTTQARLVLIGIVLVIIVTLILFVVAMVMGMTGVCYNCSVIFQAVLVLYKLVLSLFITILSLLLLTVSVTTSNGCYFAGKFMVDKEVARDMSELMGNSEEIMKYYDTCIDDKGSGRLSDLLGTDIEAQFEKVEKVFDGFNFDLSALNATNAGSLKSVSMEGYETQLLNKWLDYSLPAFDENDQADSFVTQVGIVNNAASCNPNEIVLNSATCSKTPVSTAGDAETFRENLDYCLVAPIFTTNPLVNRYNGQSCGIATRTAYNRLKDSIVEHNTLLGNMKTSLNDPKAKAVTVYTELNGAKNDIEAFQAAIKNVLDVIKGQKDGIFGIMNCRILRYQVRNFVGTTCYETVYDFSYSATYLLFIGPLFTLMAYCVVCSYCFANNEVADTDRSGKYKKGRRRPKDSGNDNRRPLEDRGMSYVEDLEDGDEEARLPVP